MSSTTGIRYRGDPPKGTPALRTSRPIRLGDGAFGSRYGKTRRDKYFARGVARGVAVKSAKQA
jgi:hypothetical protein